MMTKIIGVGNALVDVLVRLDDFTLKGITLGSKGLAKGGMTLINQNELQLLQQQLTDVQVERAVGGSAANTIYALSALRSGTAFVGSVGCDDYGKFYHSRQKARGIESLLTQDASNHTGIATTFITPDGERTFATYLGAAANIDPSKVPFEKGAILHVEGYLVQNHPMLRHLLSKAKEAGMTVSLDLASWNVVRDEFDFLHEMVESYVDIVFANQEEAAAYAGGDDMQAAIRSMAGAEQIVVIKLGKKGAIAMRGNDAEPAFSPITTKRNVIDTTAAGDFFAAGFLYGLANDCDMATCLSYGNSIAGEVIQVMGTQVPAQRLRNAINL